MTKLLEIPEVLKGKEVKEFTDWMYDDCEIINENLKAGYSHDEAREVIDFLRQPFVPEMIVKYFGGWEKADYADNVYKYNKFLLLFEDGKSMIIGTTSYNPIPTTLNQFITDCIQADIKLNWRE